MNSTYKTVIAGSRGITDYSVVCEAIDTAHFDISQVISGRADGVDSLGERWADEHGIPVDYFPISEYEDEAKQKEMPAPLARNQAMAEAGEALIAVWDGESSGTEHMRRCARNEGLEIHLVRTDSTRLDDFL